MAELTDDEQLQLDLDVARARVRAKQTQQNALQDEIAQRQPRLQEAPAQPPIEEIPEPSTRILPENRFTNMLPENPVTLGKGLIKGAAKAGLGALQTSAAVGGAIGQGLGHLYDEYAPSVGLSPRDPARVKAGEEQNAREIQTLQSLNDQIKPADKVDRVSMPVGQVAAGGLAGGAIVRGGGYLAGLAGTSIGAAAANPNQEGLLVSDKGYVGLGINPDDTPATVQTKKFINNSLDNVVTTAAFDAGTKAGGVVYRTVKDAVNAMRGYRKLPVMEKEYVEGLINIGAKIPPNATREQTAAAYQELLDRTNQYHSQKFEMGEDIEPITIEKDPTSILSEGLNPNNPVDRARQIHLESLRASAKPGNAPKTTVALERPRTALDEGLNAVQTSRGGDAAIEQTRQSFQDKAMTEAASHDIGPQLAREDLAAGQQSYQDTLRKDPDFGKSIRDAETGGVPLNIHDTERNLKSGIVRDAQAARAADKEVRDNAYKVVADLGAPADMESFSAAAKNADPFLSNDLREIINHADGSFGYLNNQVRPRISEAITQAYNSNNPVAVQELMKLRNNIQRDQMAWLTEHGNEQTIQAAQNANKINIEYSRKWNDGVGQDFLKNEKINRPKTQPINFIEDGRKIVDDVVSNPNRKESVDQLKGILGPEKEGALADTALAKATKDIQAGKGIDFDKITGDLQQMAHNFSDKQRMRFEGFLTDVKAKKMSLDDLEKKIPELQAASDAEKEKIFGDKFKSLFKKSTGKDYVGKENGYRIFQDVLNDKEISAASKGTQLDRLLENADDADRAGMQAAWAKSAQEQLGQNSREVTKFTPEFEEAGRKLFGDNPALESILQIRKEAERLQRAQVRTGIQEFDRGSNQKRMSHAVQMFSTWAFGVLNPTAARIKTITGHLLREYDSNPLAHEAIDNVLSNNQLLRDNLKRMIEETKTKISPEEKQMMKRLGLQLGLYSKKEQTEMNFPELSKGQMAKKGSDPSAAVSPKRASPMGPFKGELATGNIDVEHRPKVPNPDGGISTVNSMSYENDNGEEVLIPTVSDEGKLMGNHEAMEYWGKKGKYLGKFSNPDDADNYARQLHKSQAKYYGLDE